VIALAGIKPERALLILDEATASLSTRDASQYLDHVRGAADRGLAVIMVTHRLLEVHEYCDRSLVLRDGRAVAEFDQSSFSEVAIVHAMVGETSTRVAGARNDAGVSRGDRDLRIEGLFGDGVNGVSFSASAGEIVGLTGRSGGGASEVLRLVGGLTVPEAGSVWIGAHKLELGQPRRSIEHGVDFISADRSREGGISVLSVEDNLVLPRVERFGLARARMRAEALRMIDEMDVRPNDPDVPFGNLSGGNQQKVLLGRWLLLSPQVLLMDDPTAGVDPNARETIFAALDDLRADGVTILIRSTEPPQLARLCDRVLVFRDGELVNELNGNDINTEEISLATYA
jgi:ABC-type sugar transport system ATPase subunit